MITRETLQRMLRAVREVHAMRVAPIDGVPGEHRYCVEDRQSWPCATVRAMGEVESEADRYDVENAAGAAQAQREDF